MTFREWAEGCCVERGLSTGQAREVIDRVVEDRSNTLMQTLWDEEVVGDPQPLLAVLSRGIDRHALAWIDENRPDESCRRWFVQANQVVDRVVADPDLNDMRGRWNEDVTDYPQVLLAGLLVHLNEHALAWIEEQRPSASFKALFRHMA